jgi:arginyl-tRNA synthetase
MIKQSIYNLVYDSVKVLEKDGVISSINAQDLVVEKTKDPKFGDYSTNIAMKLAKDFGKPLDLAGLIVTKIQDSDLVDGIDVLAPGFINFKLSKQALSLELNKILAEGEGYGNLNLGEGKKAQVEYLSANPTGPLHIGNARGMLGDVIASVLKKAGYQVETEYYINDIGGQAIKFAKTLVYWFKKSNGEEVDFPEGGYPGDYYQNLSIKVVQALGISNLKGISDEDLTETFRKEGFKLSMADIKETICKLGIKFDKFVSQEDINDKITDKVFYEIEQKGYSVEKDGAIWFSPSKENTDFEDKESVLKKSEDLSYTYFADDIAYHWNKFTERKFDLVIDVWGSNHYGHIQRMKSAIQAIGANPDNLKIVLYQFVRLKQGDTVTKMAKRAGTYITTNQVLDEIPSDVFKFFNLLRSPDTHLDFDFELAKDTTDKNPLYYTQYALARMHGVLRQSNNSFLDANLTVLQNSEELDLIKHLASLPEVIEEVSQNYQVQRLPYFAIDLAKKFHSFYDKHRVLGEDESLTKARLALVKASSIVMTEVLGIIGVDAPERM